MLFKDKWEEWRSNQFRTAHDFQRILLLYQALGEEKAILKMLPKKPYKNIDSMILRLERQDIKENLSCYRPKLFCINDSEKATDEDRKNIKKLYRKLFPDKSEFEK